MGDEWMLGEDDERPTHEVTLKNYKIGKTEVTVAQYRAFWISTGKSMPTTPDWGWQDNHPIVNVSWHDAVAYCDWLSEKHVACTAYLLRQNGNMQPEVVARV